MMICFLRMRSLRLRSVWKRIRPLMFFIPMRTRYGLIFPNISSRISNRISIWIFCDPTIISVISLLYVGKLQKKPVVSVRSTTVRRIMILFSAVRRWRERSYTFRGYCTTGESTVLLRQTTRRANCTRTRREKRRSRAISFAVARREPLHCGRITAFMMWSINCRERLWFPF